MTTTDGTVSCDNCDDDIPRDATRCPTCGVMVVTLGRAAALVVIGLLLIPVGIWAVFQIRDSSLPILTVLLHGALVFLPIFLMYAGSRLYRHRQQKLTDGESLPEEVD